MPPGEQRYENHAHQPVLFIAGGLCWLAAVIAFVLGLIWTPAATSVALVLMLAALACSLLIGRAYIVRLQDRIIMLELRLRAEKVLSPGHQAALWSLSKPQRVALRFASDAELPALIERARDESLSPDQIKRAVRNWQPDYDRT